MTKYKNVITGQEITVYPWSSKTNKIKVQGENWLTLFEENLEADFNE